MTKIYSVNLTAYVEENSRGAYFCYVQVPSIRQLVTSYVRRIFSGANSVEEQYEYEYVAEIETLIEAEEWLKTA